MRVTASCGFIDVLPADRARLLQREPGQRGRDATKTRSGVRQPTARVVCSKHDWSEKRMTFDAL